MYDPLVEAFPKPHQPYPESYWSSVTGRDEYPELKQSLDAEVAIIGAGYTGLSAAYHLQQTYKVSVVVVDANDVGWGCSGRNAGFIIPGTGRLSLLQIKDRWGTDVSKVVGREFGKATKLVRELISKGGIDCDLTDGGYLRLAYKMKHVNGFKKNAELYRSLYASNCIFTTPEHIADAFLKSQHAFGGLYYPDCFGVNPLKLALGYAELASLAGALIYTHSPVIEWQQGVDSHVLCTPKGKINCRRVIVASNGYTGHAIHSLVKQRHFPVLSSIIVTRPLSHEEKSRLMIKPGLLMMDTRPLKYYYRLLPDGRLLFGGRGAVKGKNANKAMYARKLLKALKVTFPELSDITIGYFWSGWVSVAYDDYPRVWSDERQSVFYSMGYCGSGVSFSTLAGKRVAQAIMDEDALPNLPYYRSALPEFPFASMRRVGLSVYYKWVNLTSSVFN